MNRFDTNVHKITAGNAASNYCGPLSSTRDGGRYADVSNEFGSLLKDCMVFTPYGISSCPVSGVVLQSILNCNCTSSVVGVFDKNKPKVKYDEVCLYTSKGQTVYLKEDGSILVDNGKNASISIGSDGSIDVNCVSFKVNGKQL